MAANQDFNGSATGQIGVIDGRRIDGNQTPFKSSSRAFY
jgi:hypothetical protein